MKKNVYIFLFDGFSDWEISFLSPELKKSDDIELRYFSKDGEPVMSAGGLNVLPDQSLAQVDSTNIDMLILPGGTMWENDEDCGIDFLLKTLFVEGKSIAAICAATTNLAKLGFLRGIKHTSNDLNYIKVFVPEYAGENQYVNTLSVHDKNIITANGIAPIEFAKDVFTALNLHSDSDIEKWFQLFKNGVWSN